MGDAADSLTSRFDVSRETLDRLSIYADLVRKWQKSQNLVAPSTLPHLWERHIADSYQLHALCPDVLDWLDIGSGAGFPGLVTAIALAGRPRARVRLIESNAGKAAFLRTVARETGAPAEIICERIEKVVPEIVSEPPQAISARALAALTALLRLTEPLTAVGVPCFFHKGQDFAAEVREATLSWDIDLIQHSSKVNSEGVLVDISRAVRRPKLSQIGA